ncbi:MAG: XrtB/PEP-CTERM-associated polysaccharide biosynthesis outer membrane protein EpsL [Methylophilaceae bacterium]
MRPFPPFPASPISAAVCLSLLIASSSVQADGMFDIKPYVAATATYDDNVFRLTDKNEARAVLGSEAMGDTSRLLEAGLAVDWKISAQHLRLGLSASQNSYDRFGFLDNDGHDLSLAWDWNLGSHLAGRISTSENLAMAGFNEVNNPALNERTTTQRLYSLNWNFHPSWRLHLQRDEVQQENGLVTFRSSDREDIAHEASMQYSSAAGNVVVLSMRQTDSEYPFRDSFATTFFGNSNQQRDIALNIVWQPSGKTRLNGRLARVERTYKELSQRNVSALAGRLEATWLPTGKTSLAMSLVHDIYAVDDIAATYVQSDAVNITPTWVPTAKLTIQARASFEKRGYQGDPGFLLGATLQREDTLKTTGVTVSYMPYEKIQTQLSWQKQSRTSSTAGSGYDANTLNFNIRVNF